MYDICSDHNNIELDKQQFLPILCSLQRKRNKVVVFDEERMENQKFTTVDLSQFRNTEIGKGYQARGVIRQRNHSNEHSATKVVNMMEAQKKDGLNNESSHRQQQQQQHPSSSNDVNRTNQTVTKHEMNTPSEYLACKGIREFRKEIEKILNQ